MIDNLRQDRRLDPRAGSSGEVAGANLFNPEWVERAPEQCGESSCTRVSLTRALYIASEIQKNDWNQRVVLAAATSEADQTPFVLTCSALVLLAEPSFRSSFKTASGDARAHPHLEELFRGPTSRLILFWRTYDLQNGTVLGG